MSASSSSSSPYIVYYAPLSMPSRAVKQLLLEANLPCDFRFVDTIAGATRTPEFLAINPVGQIPVLVDGDFTLTESSAILQYLVNQHQLNDWYPTELRSRARVNQYLHWHASGVRQVFARLLIHSFSKKDPVKVKEAQDKMPEAFAQLERFFSASRYIGSDTHPTIADLQLFHELVQPFNANLFDFSTAPKTSAWFEEFKKRPATIKIQEELDVATTAIRAKLAEAEAKAAESAPSS